MFKNVLSSISGGSAPPRGSRSRLATLSPSTSSSGAIDDTSAGAASASASYQPLLDRPDDVYADDDNDAARYSDDDATETDAMTGATADMKASAEHAEGLADDLGPGAGRSSHRRDAAAALLRAHAVDHVTPADDARVLRKIDLVLLPLMLGVYFLQGLDKATLAYASVFGLLTDTGLTGSEYSWLGSIVYLAQLIMQPPLAWLLVKLPVGKFSSVMVLLWGVTLACMAAAHNFSSLMATRFFLGAFEASVAPSFVAITQMWWRRREQTVRVASWYAMNGLTNMVSGGISPVLVDPAC